MIKHEMYDLFLHLVPLIKFSKCNSHLVNIDAVSFGRLSLNNKNYSAFEYFQLN